MDLKKLISQGESEILEFKESLQLKDEMGETVSALSNSKGGVILVGISDKGEIKGIQIGKRTVIDLAEYIKRNTDPQIFPEIKVCEIDNEQIILMKVKESGEKPVFFKNHAYKRVGDTNQRIPSSEIRKLAKESGVKIYWDSLICEEASLKDIDEEKIRWFLKKTKIERNFSVDDRISVEEILQKLDLLRENKLTNAAILLFGKDPQKSFLQAEIRCARFKGDEPVKPFIDMKVFTGNIINQVDKALGFILEHISMKVYLVGRPEREERYEYPPDALREAIINAICHRDYASVGHIQIRIFDDRIEVWNPGLLPEPLTIEDLKKKHKSIPRNPLIAKCFFLIKLIEQWGTGTNDMIKFCLDWGLPEPLFECITGDFVVTFKRSVITVELMDKLGLNQRQRKAIRYIEEHKKISRMEYAKLDEVSDATAKRDLKELVDKGILEIRGNGPETYYVLSRYEPI